MSRLYANDFMCVFFDETFKTIAVNRNLNEVILEGLKKDYTLYFNPLFQKNDDDFCFY